MVDGTSLETNWESRKVPSFMKSPSRNAGAFSFLNNNIVTVNFFNDGRPKYKDNTIESEKVLIFVNML